ncbi:hypothetical protein EYF80_015934 [Liparis tanakae]|uniref:Uncharacterized protein n=1 Tax=Liparis tanakae TaxID=230148 RepID=A0A4Z2I7A0_9TELE|nr:hypothetical protein EYF80_015934 [Liparis tanakae]
MSKNARLLFPGCDAAHQQPCVTVTPSELSNDVREPLTLTPVIQPRKAGCSLTEGDVRRSGEEWSSGVTPPIRPSTSNEVFLQSRLTRTACQCPSLTATPDWSSAGSAQKMEKRRRRWPWRSSSSRKSQKPSSSRLKLSTLSQQAFHTGNRPHWLDTPPYSSTSPWAWLPTLHRHSPRKSRGAATQTHTAITLHHKEREQQRALRRMTQAAWRYRINGSGARFQ